MIHLLIGLIPVKSHVKDLVWRGGGGKKGMKDKRLDCTKLHFLCNENASHCSK